MSLQTFDANRFSDDMCVLLLQHKTNNSELNETNYRISTIAASIPRLLEVSTRLY